MAKPWQILDLDPNESLKVCAHKIALTRFQETFSYESATIKGLDPEALHDMRVAARRLRAVTRIFRVCFSKKKFKKQDARLQSLIGGLGAVRELDVFLEMLAQFKKNLQSDESKAINLLIARGVAARQLERRKLLHELKLHRRLEYAESFASFLKSAR